MVLVILIVIPVIVAGSLFYYVPKMKRLSWADAIVVLGHPANADGSLSEPMRETVELAIELLTKGLAKAIIFTGGAVRNEHTEAHVMAQFAMEQGVPSNIIYTDGKARDTIENSINVKQILEENGLSNIILISTPYHIRRSSFLFQKQGIPHQIAYPKNSYQLKNLSSRLKALTYDIAGTIWIIISRTFHIRPFWSLHS